MDALRSKLRESVRSKRHGGSVVEAAFLMPWIAFLFVGVVDFGFYSYAAICTENAARAAAVQTAKDRYSQLTSIACAAALGELKGLPNMRVGGVPVSTCAASPGGITSSLPVAVSISTLTSATTPPCADCATGVSTATDESVQAVVTYQTLAMIPIPGVLMGQMRLTRIEEARVLR